MPGHFVMEIMTGKYHAQFCNNNLMYVTRIDLMQSF